MPGMPSTKLTAMARVRTTTSFAAGAVYIAGPTVNAPPGRGSQRAELVVVMIVRLDIV